MQATPALDPHSFQAKQHAARASTQSLDVHQAPLRSRSSATSPTEKLATQNMGSLFTHKHFEKSNVSKVLY